LLENILIDHTLSLLVSQGPPRWLTSSFIVWSPCQFPRHHWLCSPPYFLFYCRLNSICSSVGGVPLGKLLILSSMLVDFITWNWSHRQCWITLSFQCFHSWSTKSLCLVSI
jgi:hypothetical protein